MSTLQKYIIKFCNSAMLPQLREIQQTDVSINCNCKIFNMTGVNQQQSDIFLAKNRYECFFQNQTYNAYPRTTLVKKQKLSLRRNQYRRVKENIAVLSMARQQELLDKTWAKTDIMTRADSQMMRTVNQYPQQNQFSCFSSYVFKEINLNEHQGSFGRFMQFNRNEEIKNQKQITRSRCKSIPEINCQNTPGISDRSKKQGCNQLRQKDQFQLEIKRNAKSQVGGQVVKIHNFYSQPYLKNQPFEANEYQRQVSSIIFNIKHTNNLKKTHLLESLKFKDTESINDEESSLFSEVISEQNEIKNDKGQFSLVMTSKPFWRRNTAVPKLSKFK